MTRFYGLRATHLTASGERASVLLNAGVAIQVPHERPRFARGVRTVPLVTPEGLFLGVCPADGKLESH